MVPHVGPASVLGDQILMSSSTIIFAYQPSLLARDSEAVLPESNNAALAASSAKTLLDIVAFAELVSYDLPSSVSQMTTEQIDPKAITQPWVGYPLYIAGRVFRESHHARNA